MRDEPMSAAAFEEQVLETIRSRNMLQPGDRVIAAVSGGADSMALLRFFLRRGRELGITLEAAHVNHGLRDAAGRPNDAARSGQGSCAMRFLSSWQKKIRR